ncbi:MAG: DUF547 domain-containing protein [Planctomycetota bacterium]|jgi:hypothetical protein
MSQELRNGALVLVLLAIIGLFSPYGLAEETNEQGFDFSDYATVLKTFVDEKAMVNYSKLKAQPQRLKEFAAAIGKLDPDSYEKWGEKDKIAFWLNAYNALTLKVIIDNYPIKSSFFRSRIYPKNSIRQITGVWDKITFNVIGQNLTLGHIEHKILRVKFNEPRIHMAMVCAAMGCPPLRNEPYTGSKLDEQLNDQTRRFLANSAKFKIELANDRLYLSPIFKWFADDFVNKYDPKRDIAKHRKKASAVLNFVATHLEEADRYYVLKGDFKIKYLKYDWFLNEQQTKD